MVKCIGKNGNGRLRICACFMRQIKGCSDDKMKTGENVRINFARVIQQIDWKNTTVCRGVNEGGEDGRICICLDGENGQKAKSCGPKMKIVHLTKTEVLTDIENLVC